MFGKIAAADALATAAIIAILARDRAQKLPLPAKYPKRRASPVLSESKLLCNAAPHLRQHAMDEPAKSPIQVLTRRAKNSSVDVFARKWRDNRMLWA